MYTIQGQRCTIAKIWNDGFWHKWVSFDKGPEAPIDRFGMDDRRVESADR